MRMRYVCRWRAECQQAGWQPPSWKRKSTSAASWLTRSVRLPTASKSADHRVSHASATPHSRQTADRVGRASRASQRRCAGLCGQQKGRLWLEFLPAYAPELNPVKYLWSHWNEHELPNFLPCHVRAVEPLRRPGTPSHAPTPYSGDRLLAAGRNVSFGTILCNTQ